MNCQSSAANCFSCYSCSTPIPGATNRPDYPRPTKVDVYRGLTLDIEARIAQAQRMAVVAIAEQMVDKEVTSGA